MQFSSCVQPHTNSLVSRRIKIIWSIRFSIEMYPVTLLAKIAQVCELTHRRTLKLWLDCSRHGEKWRKSSSRRQEKWWFLSPALHYFSLFCACCFCYCGSGCWCWYSSINAKSVLNIIHRHTSTLNLLCMGYTVFKWTSGKKEQNLFIRKLFALCRPSYLYLLIYIHTYTEVSFFCTCHSSTKAKRRKNNPNT